MLSESEWPCRGGGSGGCRGDDRGASGTSLRPFGYGSRTEGDAVGDMTIPLGDSRSVSSTAKSSASVRVGQPRLDLAPDAGGGRSGCWRARARPGDNGTGPAATLKMPPIRLRKHVAPQKILMRIALKCTLSAPLSRKNMRARGFISRSSDRVRAMAVPTVADAGTLASRSCGRSAKTGASCDSTKDLVDAMSAA